MSMEDIGSQILDLSLSRYVSKNVELNMHQGLVNATYDTLQRRKIALKTEQEQLDNESCDARIAEDLFCNKIWDFSFKHNFNAIFNWYPDVIGMIKPNECLHCAKHLNNGQNNHVVQDCDDNIIMRDLICTMDDMNKEIIFIQSENVEQKINDALINLSNLRSFTQEISELIRLINVPQVPRNSYNNIVHLGQQQLEYANCHEKNDNSVLQGNKRFFNKLSHNTTQSFISAKKLMKRPSIHTCSVTEAKITASITTSNEGSQKCQTNTGSVKLGKFVMKKQSCISLKYEENKKYLDHYIQSKKK